MNRLMVVAAACLMASGCANNRMLGCRSCEQPCHITRSQNAPRPEILRTACDGTGCGAQRIQQAKKRGSLGKGDLLDRLLTKGTSTSKGDDGCQHCDGRGCELCQRIRGAVRAMNPNPHAGGYPEQPTYNPGPPSGQVAYPYYTVRGPRDFLQSNPPSIGPY